MATSFFAGRHHRCSLCSQRRISAGGETLIECYHRGVVAHLIGYDIPLVLDMEMLRPGETEIAAAARLLERLLARYGRFFDAVLGDALYLGSQIFNLCTEHGKHALAVLKANNASLKEDAIPLLCRQTPLTHHEDGLLIRYWDEDGFRHGAFKAPLRVLRTEEVSSRRTRMAGTWVQREQTSQWMWATTIPKSKIGSRALCQIAHQRWQIENRIFNSLSRHWGLDHCFRHHPVAMVNFILTLFIAHTLVQCFYNLNMKEELRRRYTIIGLAAALLRGVGAMSSGEDAWVNPSNHSPPR